MAAYFDIIKLIFFILTIIIVLFQLRIKWVMPESIVDVIGPFMLPFYFILLWLIIGYIIGYIKSVKSNEEYEDKSYIQWFIIGWVIWVIFSAVYYFIIWA